jgi:hypothetical protein
MSTQLNVCFNGCSFTVGEGFPLELRKKYIYESLVSEQFNFNSTNIAKGGSSNYTIFMRSADAIISKKYDIIFTQWTALNRVWFSPGPDAQYFLNNEKYSDFTYRDLYINPTEKTKFKNTLLMLNHDYQNIIELVDYCKILKQLTTSNQIKLVFINGLVPWQNDLVYDINANNLSSSLSEYTKSILDFDNRDDDEIVKYFTKLQQKFAELDQTNWVNLFNSFHTNTIDVGPEGHHPGVDSHRWLTNQILTYLTNKL